MRLFLCSAILIFFSSQNLAAQSEWFSIDTKERSADKDFKQVFQIVNESSNELVTFYQFSNFFVAYLHNTKGERLNIFSAQALPKNKRNYIGSSINGNDYTLFFQNDYATKFSALTINFTTLKFDIEDTIDVISNIESVIGSFEYKSHIYILTSVKRSSELKLHKLINHKDFSVETFDFSDEKFVSPRGFEISLNHLLDNGYDSPRASLIENNEPGSLEDTAKKNKLFLENDQLILTNDLYDTSTTYISINLNNGNTKTINFQKASFNKKDRGSKSNSFVLDNYFFNVYVTKEQLDFSIYNIDSQELVKSIKINEKDTIAFKNSPIIVENGELDNYRELDKTKQFLRKVSNAIAGIHVYKKNGLYIITIGGCEPITQANDFVILGGFVGGIALGVMVATLTPSYDSYTRTKSTRIECLFNENFESIEGSIPENEFDKIEKYMDSQSNIKFRHKSIIKANNNYILGYFEKKTGIYKYILIE